MLSILIPSYKFIKGVNTILEVLNNSNSFSFEVIVMDDSPNYEIYERLVDKKFNFQFYIYKGDQKGPIHNWNKLLKMKKMKFFMLLHQDEIPCINFIEKLFLLLKSNNPKILSINTFIFKNKYRSQIHSNAMIRKLFYNMSPYLLYRINFIGPVSSLIFHKNINLEFDSNLHWLVDVDAYIKLQKYKWHFVDDIYVKSINNEFSITNKTDTKNQYKSEMKYINYKESFNFRIKKLFIIIIWYSIKILKYIK